jgi:hypothetical protein
MATTTSSAYVLGVTKEKIFESIFKVFYNRIAHVVSDPKSRSKFVYPAFPDIDIDSSEEYPIIVINSAEIDWEKFTFTKRQYNAQVDIDIYSTKQSELDQLSSQTVNAIEASNHAFDIGNLQFLTLTATNSEHVFRDKITVHRKTLSFTFSMVFNRT